MSEVQTSRSSQLPAAKNILVLGDKESGKTTLVAKLQGNEDPKKGAGLEYGYIDVRDEYRDGKCAKMMAELHLKSLYSISINYMTFPIQCIYYEADYSLN